MTGQDHRERVLENLLAELDKPYTASPRRDGVIYCDDQFDPWQLFPAIYGTYSADFGQCALDVLRELRGREKIRDDLGAEMFREMLCTAGFCEYGTSPRVCFWDLERETHPEFPILERLIERWEEFERRLWL